MDPRETRSEAPTASTGRAVARGACLRGCVLTALRAGARAQAVLMGHACPLKLGRDEHAADETPRHIPDSTDRPFGLHSATSRRHMPSRTERGTSALAGRGAVPCSKRASFPSSSRTQSSLVAQDWPAAEPRRALLKLSRKACWGRCDEDA